MRISQRVSYGITCMLELSKFHGEFVRSEDVARARQIPPSYAQKILQGLANKGLVVSQKGKGYRLDRPLGEITALVIINALQAKPLDVEAQGNALLKLIENALADVTLEEMMKTAASKS